MRGGNAPAVVKLLTSLLTAAILLPAAAAAAPAAAPAPTCTHSQLRVTRGPAQGTAGHFHWPIRFRNTSATACSLRGFPAVRSTRSGQLIGAAASRDHAVRGRTIRLAAHGGVASAVFTQTDVGVFDPSQCHPRLATGLRVKAPGQTSAFAVALRHRLCTTTPPGGSDSTIRAVVRGTTGL